VCDLQLWTALEVMIIIMILILIGIEIDVIDTIDINIGSHIVYCPFI